MFDPASRLLEMSGQFEHDSKVAGQPIQHYNITTLFMPENVILVNEEDVQTGLEDKLAAHLGQGKLHRAFSVFIFNSKGEFLLQQRSAQKMLWPLHWTNTCCSHPRENEDYQAAGQRRLQEEMGFTCLLKMIGKFQYQARYKDAGSEYELCRVLVGEYDGQVAPDPKEVADCKWVDFGKVKKDVASNPDAYTPWFKMELERFFK